MELLNFHQGIFHQDHHRNLPYSSKFADYDNGKYRLQVRFFKTTTRFSLPNNVDCLDVSFEEALKIETATSITEYFM